MTATDIQDMIVWDAEGFATLPDDAPDVCDNPFDWTPIAHTEIPADQEDA